ncbi:MAG: CoA transferase [Gammaproteobacteria bacterium]|nr:CoA transferase [Gammaproteobacteria bacterium]
MRPLEGIRILDFTHVLAGPFCTRLLADMGADVVKVNSAKRAAANNAPSSPYYAIWNRNKRALALDMSHDRANDVARSLANQADVVIDNFSLGVLDRWGIGYEEVSASNDQVIYVQMSGMGGGGPWSDFVTYAPTIHALAGLTYMTGVPDGGPIGLGFSYNDHQAGLHGAVAILSAIEARRQTGKGQQVDLAQFEVGTAMIGVSLLDYFVNGREAHPCGNRVPYDKFAPHGCFLCRPDGDDILEERWLAIVCRDEGEWNALCSVMGDPEWCRADSFSTAELRCENAEALDRYVNEWTSEMDANELMYTLQEAGVPAGVVQTGIDLAETDPQLKSHEFIRFMDEPHPGLGETFADRLPIYFEKTPCDTYKRSRMLGEDNVSVLADWLGMSEEEVRTGEEAGYLT